MTFSSNRRRTRVSPWSCSDWRQIWTCLLVCNIYPVSTSHSKTPRAESENSFLHSFAAVTDRYGALRLPPSRRRLHRQTSALCFPVSMVKLAVSWRPITAQISTVPSLVCLRPWGTHERGDGENKKRQNQPSASLRGGGGGLQTNRTHCFSWWVGRLSRRPLLTANIPSAAETAATSL